MGAYARVKIPAYAGMTWGGLRRWRDKRAGMAENGSERGLTTGGLTVWGQSAAAN